MINLRNCDCMPCIIYDEPNSVDFTLTDIPYGEVNRKDNGLRSLDRGIADVETFNLNIFLEGIYKITKNSICIFCGREQFSQIYSFFASKEGTVRPIIWQKIQSKPYEWAICLFKRNRNCRMML